MIMNGNDDDKGLYTVIIMLLLKVCSAKSIF